MDNSVSLILGLLFITIAIVVAIYAFFSKAVPNYGSIVARSTGYLLSLSIVVTVFLVVSSTLIHIISGNHISILEGLLFALFNVLTALAFPHLKTFFDRVTNSVFYRDAYNTEALLERLNNLFVTTTNLDTLLRKTSAILTETFNTEYCYFSIHDEATNSSKRVGQAPVKLNEVDVKRFRQLIPHIPGRIIVTKRLSEDQLEAREMLEHYGADVIGRLSNKVNPHTEGVGYVVLGPRRSGSTYDARDLRTLETVIGELVIAIENSLRFEQISHFNETLQANVTEATRNLRRSNDKLQQLDATKDEFITMASHQLRTPLTSVKGYLSMVLEGDAGKLNKQQQELLTQSYISAQRMVYLIADLLNLSRLGTGKFVIDSKPTNLADVVQGEADQIRETAKSRGVTLEYTKPAEFPQLLLDETKIHQVVMNFIDNAVYYTRSGGIIQVELHETPTIVEFTVKDNGIGIPKSEQHKLFAKFYRAGNARQMRPDGTGLGLFMAKKVIVAQGGAIIFDSTEGKGSTFGFRFSKAKHKVPVKSADISVS